MSKKIISGIQQVGVGVRDVKTAWKWYRQHFGMDINVFEDTAVAELMLPYTEGKTRERYAALAVNMEGGGGFEIWQHNGFEPRYPLSEILLGDYGIFVTKLKCRDIVKAYHLHKANGLNLLTELVTDPVGNQHYFIKDPWENIFEVVNEESYFKKQKSHTGGVFGVSIGVSDIEKALTVYSDILEYDEVVYDRTENFDDLKGVPGGDLKFRRVLLKHSNKRKGHFVNLLGPTQIELFQVFERKAKKIYEGRIWGEPGFIHICFDINGMSHLREECNSKGFPFTVDSANSFDMGVAAGHFAYISDPDGTPVEFVETHKLPVIKKLGWYMKLKDRNPDKPLPNWMVSTIAFGRIKD